MARWEGNKLYHAWYGSTKEDMIAFLSYNPKDYAKASWATCALVFDGIYETLVKPLAGRISASEALRIILNWQLEE